MSEVKTEIRASIDLGTNTCILLVAEVDPKSKHIIQIFEDISTIVRLGQGVDHHKELAPDAMKRTLECLENYSMVSKSYQVVPSKVRAVATSQARDAKNGATFFEVVKRQTGFDFKTLSGDEEAQCTFRGALLPEMDAKRYTVIDIGGGSTELTTLQQGQSLDIGAVRFTERFFKTNPVSNQEYWNCLESIDQAIRQFPQNDDGKKLLAVAGTATTLAMVQMGLPFFIREYIEKVELTRGDVHRLVEEFKWRTLEERKRYLKSEEKRADVILAGSMILWRVMERLNYKTCQVSTRGLRFGAIL